MRWPRKGRGGGRGVVLGAVRFKVYWRFWFGAADVVIVAERLGLEA